MSLNNFKLFDFPYEFDDNQMRQEIEQHIIDTFYFYSIGQETPDRFKHVFKKRFLAMISYYNKLHNTTMMQYDPLANYKVKETFDKTRDTQGNQKTNSNANTNTDGKENTTTNRNEHNKRTDNLTEDRQHNQKTSDYPQQNINVGNYLDDETIENGQTKNTGTQETDTTAQENTDTNTSGTEKSDENTDTQSSENDNTHYQKTVEGITGITYQDLIQKERANIIRMKGDIINELKPCFMLVY